MAIVIGGSVAAAGAIGSAAIGSSSASSAANTQANAANNASAAQIYQTNAAINEQNALTEFEANLNNPNRQSGNYAQQALEYALGLPQTNLQPVLTPNLGSSIQGTQLLNFGGPNGVQQQTGGYGGQPYNTGAKSGQQLTPGGGQQAATPTAGGPGAPGSQQIPVGGGVGPGAQIPGGGGSAGGLGGLFTPFNYTAAQYQQSPGYQFTLGQGLEAVNNQASAMGLSQSPNTQKALAQYAEGLANRDYQQAYSNAYQAYTQNQSNTLNTLGSAAGWGNTATANIGGAAGNAATNISNLQQGLGSALGSNIIGAGNATAAGQVGVGNAITGGLGNLSNTLTQGINTYFQPNSGTGYGFSMPGGSSSGGYNYSNPSYGLGSGLNFNLNQ
jgi:hypothetical protein